MGGGAEQEKGMRNDEKYYRGCGSVELTNESENERIRALIFYSSRCIATRSNVA